MTESYQNCMKCGYRLVKVQALAGRTAYECPYCTKYESPTGLHRDMGLGDFVLIEKLGSGGMGEVWKAEQRSMNRDVALKILSPELSRDEVFVERFLKEAVMTGRLRHPNIVTAYTAGDSGDYYYLATLFIDGMELQDKIHIDGMMPEREALNIARAIASALCYAWEHHHMLHCDIKPGNIMIDRRSTPYLMDMGISKIVSETDTSHETYAAGSPQYMSPEQAAGHIKLDFRTDIYSLGVTLYQMVTNSLPFNYLKIADVKAVAEEPQFSPAISRNPCLSPGCSGLISKMMSYRRENRQSDWNFAIADIDSAIAGTYTSGKKAKVKKWDAIKPGGMNINSPINLGGNKEEKPAPPEEELTTDTQKIPEEGLKIAPVEKEKTYRLPPVVFDGTIDRRSGMKLLIIATIIFIIAFSAIVYLIVGYYENIVQFFEYALLI